MSRIKYYFAVASILTGLACQVSAETLQNGYELAGSIRPRPARQIKASNWSVGAETMDRDYTVYQYWKMYLGPLGFKKARIQGGWAKTEKSPKVYDWKWLDEIIYDMVDQGVEPWMCLCYGNSLYTDGGGTNLGANLPSSGQSFTAWHNWVQQTVKRYANHIDEWEVWNEPNLRGSNSPSSYADFLIRTAKAIQDIQPQAKILAMSMAGVDIKYARDVLQYLADQGQLELIDEITYHPYSFNPDDSYKQVAKLREVISVYSNKITIRQGENGAPSTWRKTKALSNYNWSEISQAKWALRRLLGDLGNDIPSSYFSIIDMKYPDEMNMKGLLKSRDDQTVEYPKPSYHALVNLASIFDNQLRRIAEYKYSSKTDRNLSVFAYENINTKAQAVTIWLDSDTPSDKTDMMFIDFEFDSGSFPEPFYIDIRTGQVYRIPDDKWSRTEKKYKFNSVPCYDSPILISDKSNILINSTNK